jgi:hypothetical protein
MVTMVSSLVGGITLGLRFKALILIPTVSAAAYLIGVAPHRRRCNCFQLFRLVGTLGYGRGNAGASSRIFGRNLGRRCRRENAEPPMRILRRCCRSLTRCTGRMVAGGHRVGP